MSEVKQHGRRRATTPATPEIIPALPSRRESIALERAAASRPAAKTGTFGQTINSGFMHGAGQKVGMALAATGLVLAVTVPGTTVTLASDNTPVESTSAPIVSASAASPVTFDSPAVASALNPDGVLKETLKVEASNVTPQEAKGTLGAPLKSLVPSSPFGQRVSPITGELGEMHRGQDFAIACGTSVFAAAGGTVTFAGWHPYGGGNRVVIDHGNGLSTTYNHLTSSSVKVGQKVERGEQIALSGTTGASTGCHLHFEVMVDDDVVDPMGWL